MRGLWRLSEAGNALLLSVPDKIKKSELIYYYKFVKYVLFDEYYFGLI